MMINRDILYVEDNFHNRRIVRKILERKNFNLLEAEDGITGYQMIQDLKPHVVLLDISLPGMDGIEIAQRVKSSDATEHVVLIALTASAMAGDRERFLAAGCDDYLSKPFKAVDLIEIVEKHYDEAWAYRADRQTFKEPTLVPEPAEIMRVEPDSPPVEEQVEVEQVIPAQEETQKVEEPVEQEAVAEAKEEVSAAEEPVEPEAVAEVQAEGLVEEAPEEVEVEVEVQEEVPAEEELVEPQVVPEFQADIPIDELLLDVEANVDEPEETSAVEELAEVETVIEVQEEPLDEAEPVGDLRKALEAVTEDKEDAPVEVKSESQEEPVNAWLPEAEVLEKKPDQEVKVSKFLPDTAELVLPPDSEPEDQEEPEAVQEEDSLPASEKVAAVLEELEQAEAKSNNNKSKQGTAPKKSETKKAKPEEDNIFDNVFGMINSETIKPLSPNAPSEKQ